MAFESYGIQTQGFVMPTFQDVLDIVHSKYREKFGADVNLNAEHGYGALATIEAEIIFDIFESVEGAYYATSINQSSGVSLDNNVKFGSIARLPPQKSTVTLDFTGSNGTVILAGSLFETPAGIQFVTLSDVTIAGGVASVTAQSFLAGLQNNVASGSVTVDVDGISGLATVTNQAPAFGGDDIETDANLKARYADEANNARGTNVDGIRFEVLSVEGVTSCEVVENDTDEIDPDGRPPSSIEVIVVGGSDADIAQAIFDSKSAGIQTVGDESAIVTDSKGNTHTIRFNRATAKNVYVKVDYVKDAEFGLTGEADMVAAIINYIGGTDTNPTPDVSYQGLNPGDDVLHHRVVGAVGSVTGLVSVDVRIGFAPAPSGTVNLTILSTELARTQTSFITLTDVTP